MSWKIITWEKINFGGPPPSSLNPEVWGAVAHIDLTEKLSTKTENNGAIRWKINKNKQIISNN